MSRRDLINDVANIVEGCGFELSPHISSMTYQQNVSYDSLIPGKHDRAHFLLHSYEKTIQITVKWQEVSGTAIEKLGHTILDAKSRDVDHYIVVCGGGELVMRAIHYLNENAQNSNLIAMEVHELEEYLLEILAEE